MTLVYRSPKLAEGVVNQNPGPGAYRVKEGVGKKEAPSAAFVSKVKREYIRIEDGQPGPSSYFKDGPLAHAKTEGGYQAVFNSKIERFPLNDKTGKQVSKQKEFAQQFNELMKKEKNEHSYKGKLIDLKLRRQKQQKLNDLQCLPSIPSHQHSYGYRVDYNTNKLVNNYNPKVIFTQATKPANKEDFYFQRSHHSLAVPKKCLINSTAKRTVNELAHQLSNPSLNAYHAEKYYTIEEQVTKNKKNQYFQSSLPRFGDNSPSKKELLKINKMKRDFDMYIDDKDQIDINQLENSKRPGKEVQKSPSKRQEGNRPQCFLSKQSRFQHKTQKDTPQRSPQKQSIKLLNNKSASSQKRASVVSQQGQKRKQPFDLGVERFQPRHKKSLGPGVYQLKEQTFKHGVNLKQNQQRFKLHFNVQQVPGPGSYEVNRDVQIREKVRCPFSKHRNNEYFNEIKAHKGKEHSMEDLYQQVGKHMNYLNKIEKIDSKSKQNRQYGFKRSESTLNLDNMSQAKKLLKEKLELGKEIPTVDKENRCHEDTRNPKYHHLYVYNKPQEKPSGLGPGCYEVRTDLNKKTFNKTVKP